MKAGELEEQTKQYHPHAVYLKVGGIKSAHQLIDPISRLLDRNLHQPHPTSLYGKLREVHNNFFHTTEVWVGLRVHGINSGKERRTIMHMGQRK